MDTYPADRSEVMTRVARAFTGMVLACTAASLGAVALAADNVPKPAPAATARSADMAEKRKDMIQRRLDGAASRLEIKASQQSAWQTYAAAVQALGETDAAQPAAEADAASIARERAERATAFARKLTVIADATARLQGVLSPEQKSVLTQIARHAGPHHGPAGFGRPMMGDRRGEDRRGHHRNGGDRGSMERARQ
jgi:hypothetical protein